MLKNKEIEQKLKTYCNLIEQYNSVMNLTGFKGQQLWNEGILESIFILDKAFGTDFDQPTKLLDIGAGAGFPSIPFLIYCNNPNLHLTIFEPMKKRTQFLELVKKELNLNVDIVRVRAEDYGINNQFDLITSRAVSELKNLVEISYYLAKPNGLFSWIKGPKIFEEITKSTNITNLFQIQIETEEYVFLDKKLFLAKYRKTSPNPKGYPRKWSQIIN